MARVTIEDCIAHIPNRFEMTVLASRRARQLLSGMPSLLGEGYDDKPTVLALRELGAGLIDREKLDVLDQERRSEETPFPV
ncbi:MAG: DNA-directed RNA polymerase subunit omega [Zetaproteobacteria bacterium]|nr:MAG: DNA-directed RNA polymerase subunit omega [Zetaproteobacteria bacterium]